MSLALPTCVLFILLIPSVNAAQFLIASFLLLLFAATPAAVMFATDIFLFASIYASL